METKKKEVSNAMNIGQEVTKNDFYLLTENYKEYDNTGHEPFIIDRKIIEENLTFSEHVAGIRFMYGLKDPLNPNSKILFLIPCSNLSEEYISTEALLKKEGYHDHNGNLYLIQDVLLMMSQYVQNVSINNPDFNYKEITRGNFYGKESLNSLLLPQCKYIQYHMGILNNVISPVMQVLGAEFNQINEVYMDFSQPCPDKCDGGGGDWMTTMVINNEQELNKYRYFRDHLLLELEGGPQLFELYYLVSPVIAKIMETHENKEIAIQQFYTEEIVPFKALIREESYQEAAYALKETLYKLFAEYEYSNVFA
ncbi:MAG: hypothetical protein JXR05_01775 [Flavobacteriaceae bacterium]